MTLFGETVEKIIEQFNLKYAATLDGRTETENANIGNQGANHQQESEIQPDH